MRRKSPGTYYRRGGKGLMEFPYVYAWGPRLMGFSRKGQACRVLVRGAMNSALIEFEDGFLAVISRNALRKRK